MSEREDFTKFLVDLQDMQRRAYELRLPLAAKRLNDAMNTAGYERADQLERASAARSTFPAEG